VNIIYWHKLLRYKALEVGKRLFRFALCLPRKKDRQLKEEKDKVGSENWANLYQNSGLYISDFGDKIN
jgi:hypothetical protein